MNMIDYYKVVHKNNNNQHMFMLKYLFKVQKIRKIKLFSGFLNFSLNKKVFTQNFFILLL